MQQIKKMGSLGDLMKKIPGMNQMAAKGMEVNDDDLKHVEAIIRSIRLQSVNEATPTPTHPSPPDPTAHGRC